MPGHGQGQLFLGEDPYPGGMEKEREMQPKHGARGSPKEQKSSTASEREKNKLFLGKRQRREYGEIKPDPVTGDR